MLRTTIILAAVLFLIPGVTLRASGKIEPTGPFTDASAPAALKQSLEEKGYRVTLADGSILCDIWLRKAVPTGAKREVPGAIYTEIADSAVIGVVSFPKASQDFRGQDIKAGAYTLRYCLHPTDGNHMGISPYRDFLLLTPIAVDQTPDTTYKFEEVTKMSAKTIGAQHPAMFSLVLADGKEFPKLSENDHGHLVFLAKTKTSAGADLPISFVVKGVAEQ